MSKRLVFNLFLIAFLLLMFPLLWLFNQRLNYRSFLTLNTKFSINSNTYSPDKLSSTTFILEHVNKTVPAKFDVDVVSYEPFTVLGRTIISSQGNIEVFEYSSPPDALKELEEVSTRKPDISKDLFIYKNLLIYNLDGSLELANLLEELSDE